MTSDADDKQLTQLRAHAFNRLNREWAVREREQLANECRLLIGTVVSFTFERVKPHA